MISREKLQSIKEKFNQITEELNKPEVASDQKKSKELGREYRQLSPIVDKIKEYEEIIDTIEEYEDILNNSDDKEMIEMVKEDLPNLKKKKDEIEDELKLMLVPKDPNDTKDVIIEIRPGAGGEEAALFAGDLYRMYVKYAERNGFKVEPIDIEPTDIGGYKHVVFSVKGEGAYSKFKYEGGVHRVQRVPVTESGGRIHTSTATVAVLPEVEEEDIEINKDDLKIDVFHSSGPGGQNVNKLATAIRITHKPTGIVVVCQDERSQHKNRAKAMRVLRARLQEMKRKEVEDKISSDRKKQVGTGERSEKIRTYNFKENRVTDHRIGLTIYKLDRVLEGELDELVEGMTIEERTKKLSELEKE